MVLSFVMFRTIIKLILSRKNPYERAIALSPSFTGLTFFIVVLSFLFKTPLGKSLDLDMPMALLIAVLLSVGVGWAAMALLRRIPLAQKVDGAEQVFRRIQIGTSCYVALAQGANDVGQCHRSTGRHLFSGENRGHRHPGAGARLSAALWRYRHRLRYRHGRP